MDKKSVTQETASVGKSFLQVPRTEHESGNSRVPSATSSIKSGSIHFSTTVRMLAPVIWSRIQSRKKVGFNILLLFDHFAMIRRRKAKISGLLLTFKTF